MPTATDVVNAAARRAWQPPSNLSLSEWSDANRHLGVDSPEPGPYRTARTPYLKQVMDCLSPSHPARHIAFIKGVQVGGTTAGLNWIGYIADQNPAPTIITLPSEGVAKEWSTQRLTQLIGETPCLKSKLLDVKGRGSSNTVYLKRIAGSAATIKIAWSSSAKKLRSTPAANLLSDEVDGFENDPEGEGSVLVLLDGRFTNFPRGKHYKISTPTRQPSKIYGEFVKGDQRYFFVPCPICGHYQRLIFHRLHYKDGPVEYECIKCEQRFGERYKTQLLGRGVWVASVSEERILDQGFEDVAAVSGIIRKMERAPYASFHLNSMYSPIGWYSWATFAADWQSAQSSPSELKAILNQKLAEVWIEKGITPDWQAISNRKEDYEIGVVPAGGLLLTGAADVQADRIEFEIKAWGRGRECWSVFYAVIDGDTKDTETWDRFEALIRQDWPCAGGGTLPITACAVDTGFHAKLVYDFCNKFIQPAYGPAGAKVYDVRTVIPIKGGHSWTKIIETYSPVDSARKRDGLVIVTVGAAAAKQHVYDMIRRQLPDITKTIPEHIEAGTLPFGWWHFPSYEPTYFQQLCSEKRLIRNSKPVWEKDGRNEVLDIAAYSLAVANMCGVDRFSDEDWDVLAESLAASIRPKVESIPASGKRSDNYWGADRGWFK